MYVGSASVPPNMIANETSSTASLQRADDEWNPLSNSRVYSSVGSVQRHSRLTASMSVTSVDGAAGDEDADDDAEQSGFVDVNLASDETATAATAAAPAQSSMRRSLPISKGFSILRRQPLASSTEVSPTTSAGDIPVAVPTAAVAMMESPPPVVSSLHGEPYSPWMNVSSSSAATAAVAAAHPTSKPAVRRSLDASSSAGASPTATVPMAYPVTKSPVHVASSSLEAQSSAVGSPLSIAHEDWFGNALSATRHPRPVSAPPSHIRRTGLNSNGNGALSEKAKSRTPPPHSLGSRTTFHPSLRRQADQARTDVSVPIASEMMYSSNSSCLTAKELKAMDARVKKATDGFSQCLSCMPRSAMIGLYRIQEHTHHATPAVTGLKRQYVDLKMKIQGTTFDAEYAEQMVDSMRTINTFSSIQHQLNRSIHLKQMLDDKLKSKR
ncbi:uncharacterized protein LOC135828970 [Sycon ciliatum]|uniref:uncharacterized protein LOC135828970 n=1 Tax=Sycon ciliatum TaxID=27933 RepID=UPI0031F611BC